MCNLNGPMQLSTIISICTSSLGDEQTQIVSLLLREGLLPVRLDGPTVVIKIDLDFLADVNSLHVLIGFRTLGGGRKGRKEIHR
jgi:hypothetical protein